MIIDRKFTLEIDLKNPIAEIREIIQAMSDFADRLEEIQKEYEELPDDDQ